MISKNIHLITLGCDKNTVDSEVMLSAFKNNSLNIVNDLEKADLVLINTCGFINAAKEESINNILGVLEHKKINNNLKIIVTGCMVNRYKEELMQEIPEVDLFIKTNTDDLSELLKYMTDSEIDTVPLQDSKRILSTEGSSTYLKIAEGCNKNCSYCAIPLMRGKYKSKEMSKIVSETNFLLKNNIKEISLIAQDVTSYGKDLYDKYELPQLIREIENTHSNTDFWLRLLYCYPDHITEELLLTIKSSPKVCKYLDIPLQHAHPDILRMMHRNSDPDAILKLINRIRELIPDIALRTTFIVGFPGETEQHFKFLLDFIKEIKFDWMGAFTYSKEEATPASDLPAQIEEEIKSYRYNEAMAIQQLITEENNERYLGKKLKILIEKKTDEFSEETYIGRSEYQAPEIDGIIYVRGNDLKPGTFIDAEIKRVDHYDLLGEIVR